MGPMCLINVLTDMKSGRAFMAPPLVTVREGTMDGAQLTRDEREEREGSTTETIMPSLMMIVLLSLLARR